MKTRHADASIASDDSAASWHAPGKASRSEHLPPSGHADAVQLTPGFTPTAHEDPFTLHLLGAPVQRRACRTSRRCTRRSCTTC